MKIRADFLVAGGALATAVARNIDQARIAGERVGPFVLTTLLGRGGMGEVWGAERYEGGFCQRVAIKFAQATGVVHGSLDRERAILASLDHPHIARLIDGGQTADGELWFALEWIDGPSLESQALDLRERERLALFDQVASAVEYAHSRLVIHRDLKPANIRVSRNGVKLLDFGISALLSELEATEPGPYFTPAWASPEQARGEPTGTASDIYQLGRLLRHLVELERRATAAGAESADTAMPADTVTAAAAGSKAGSGRSGRASSGGPSSPGRVRAELQAIMAKATAEVAQSRYPTVTALRDDLAAYLHGRPVAAYAQGPWYALRCFVRRHRWAVAVVCATALIALAGLLAFISALNAARLDAQREAVIAAEERARAEKTTRFLEQILIEASPTQASGERPTVDVVLHRARARAAAEFATEPALRVRLLVLFARIDIEHEKHADALENLREARALAAVDRNSNDGARLEMLYAAALHQTGASGEALAVLERVHGAGIEDARLANQIARNYAQVLYQTGAVDQAITIQSEAVAAIAADDRPLRVANLINLGQMQASAGATEAAATLAQALELSRQTHGDRHPHTLLAASTNVVMLADAGRGDEAIALAAQTRDANAAVYGEGSPHHSNAVMAHGYALQRSGRRDEAEQVYREALALWQALPTASDLNSATVLQQLGDLAAEAGDHAQALVWYQQMQQRNRDGRHAADPELGQRALRLARTQRQLGQCPAALQALGAARARAAAAPAEHPVHDQIGREAEELEKLGCRRADQAAEPGAS